MAEPKANINDVRLKGLKFGHKGRDVGQYSCHSPDMRDVAGRCNIKNITLKKRRGNEVGGARGKCAVFISSRSHGRINHDPVFCFT